MGDSTFVELLPKEYGYVAIVLVLYCFFNFYVAVQVIKARMKYNVSYPTLYASKSENKDAKLFNCVQRGHQNSLEIMPMFVMLMILGGLKHPCICASLGVVYTVFRYFYFTCYSTSDPENWPKLGKYAMLALFALIFCTISFGCSIIRSP